jgi:hypothetical protein
LPQPLKLVSESYRIFKKRMREPYENMPSIVLMPLISLRGHSKKELQERDITASGKKGFLFEKSLKSSARNCTFQFFRFLQKKRRRTLLGFLLLRDLIVQLRARRLKNNLEAQTVGLIADLNANYLK